MACHARFLIPTCLLSLLVVACGHDRPPDGWQGDGGQADGGLDGQALEIIHLDVGQGDATLILGPDGTSLLFDAGPAAGSGRLATLLDERGISVLDIVLISHADADHFAGLTPLVEAGLGVEQAYTSAGGDWSDSFRRLDAALATTAASGFSDLEPADGFDLGGDAWATCTAADGRLLDGRQIQVSDDNDRSLAIHLRYGGFDYHVGGDLGGGGQGQADVESPLGALIGDMDVVHLHHHGSASSTRANWLNSTRPEMVVISVGENSYGHPAEEVAERLSGADPEVYCPLPLVFQTEAGSRSIGQPLGSFSVVTDGLRYAVNGQFWEVDE